MAKHSKRRRFTLRKVRITVAADIGALAAQDVFAGTLMNAPADKLRVMSADLYYAWTNKAVIDDSAQFGIAHGDYSAAEIEECLEALTAVDLGDKVAQERTNRLVRQVGIIAGDAGETAGMAAPFNGGRSVKTKLNWLLSGGDTLQLWVRNGSGTVYTTGSAIAASGNIWVKD